MTTIWGPLGWMTLHSITYLYPENPSHADIEILTRYMDSFRDTITCIHCHNHFKAYYASYTRTHPEWANSRFNFFLFVSRAHNAVNQRLNKPIQSTVQNCIDAFRSNTIVTNAQKYRSEYLKYLMRTWGRELVGDSMIRLSQVRELIKITNEYWSQKQDTGTGTFNFSAQVVEQIDDSQPGIVLSGGLSFATSKNVQVSLRGGRFQLKR